MKGTAQKMHPVFGFTDPADRANLRSRLLSFVSHFTKANTTKTAVELKSFEHHCLWNMKQDNAKTSGTHMHSICQADKGCELG